MIIDFAGIEASQRYFLMTQAILPRPIAWVMTRNPSGSLNLAPYSFFSPVCSNPPTLVVSMGQKPTGVEKDSYENLRRTGECVVHIPRVADLDAVNASSATLALGDSEVDQLGLAVTGFVAGGLPRLVDVPLAFACHYQQQVDLGPGPQHLVFLQVDQLYVDEAVLETVKQRQQINAEALDPLSRLGGKDYAGLGELLSRVRPG
ncbi:flavin reductase family protein [Oceanobacter sp. 3_MG-2023]|uniref:flavin reductase family protein n=1 Tax=Oceanobacter sp. 3_MG-2023 TaxID=3062622 RepID=UPI00273294F1|nr:flavin reductase family protein [Oceanobacter sp. 3_MG-2023]MDP2507193.1 flavin reductase family protein [Oceanobacter sp. 3_MG-2023]